MIITTGRCECHLISVFRRLSREKCFADLNGYYPSTQSSAVASITPIQGIPAMLLRGKRSFLCVADLHLGYELCLSEAGFNLPDQTDAILRALTSIDIGDNLLLLGDVKHSIPAARKIESYKITSFLESLSERFSSIIIVAGNHDGMLERSVPECISFSDSKGISISDIGFAHGHGWPSEDVMNSKILVWGHLHPSIKTLDRMGAAVTIKCWLRGKIHPEAVEKRYPKINVKESIVAPSFNHLLVGAPVNEESESALSPLTRSGFVVLGEQRAYTLDGIDLGVVSRISVKSRRRKTR